MTHARRGTLRTVSIRPPRLASHDPSSHQNAVQGVLPLEGFEDATPDTAVHRPAARHAAHKFNDATLSEIAQQVCQGLVEVIYGERPVNHLVRCTNTRIYNDIARRSAIARSRRRMTHTRLVHPRLERVHVQRPNPRAIEICGRLRQGERSHALAARLELIKDRWTCVALELDRKY